MSPNQLTVPQQCIRFLAVGAFVFTIAFILAASLLLSKGEAAQDQLAAKLLLKGLVKQPFTAWIRDLETGFMPFFLSQRALVGCYALATPIAWLTAFWFDTKILRREKRL